MSKSTKGIIKGKTAFHGPSEKKATKLISKQSAIPERAINRNLNIKHEFACKVTHSRIELFTTAIPSWYKKNRRDLPWRESADPYKVWLSEVILQQTRVDQGLSYYYRFAETFRDVHQLARAPIQQVLKLWEGLGYYSRAHNLHFAAKTVSITFNGVFPQTMNELKKLKGVGDYTAAAIASICFGEKVPVVDGNVLRVVSRYFNIDEPVDRLLTRRKIFSLLKDSMEHINPSDFNQGMMELGSLICRPLNPSCMDCPVSTGCLAYKENLIAIRPRKAPSKKSKVLHFNYLLIQKGNKLAVRKRDNSGIWKSMYELPYLESSEELYTGKQFSKELNGMKLNSLVPFAIFAKKVHLLSHRKIEARFWNLKELPDEKTLQKLNCNFVPIHKLKDLPFPALLSTFLNEHGLVQ